MPDISPVTIAVLIIGIVYAAARILAAAWRFDLTRWLRVDGLCSCSFDGEYAHHLLMLRTQIYEVTDDSRAGFEERHLSIHYWQQLTQEYCRLFACTTVEIECQPDESKSENDILH